MNIKSSDRSAKDQHLRETEREELLKQYGCGPVQFSGSNNGLYERHLIFDNVIDVPNIGFREKYEALACSIRDVLSQRWILTEKTYNRCNPKRIYYLSMEFLIGRSLSNNVINLLIDPIIQEVVQQKKVDWLSLIEQEPDAGLGNGGLGRLAACFLDSMATMELPAMGYGLRYEYGIFNQLIENGWQQEQPDNWLRYADPWEVIRLHEKVEVKINCSFEIRNGKLESILGRPSTLFGIPYDRPIIGYGGKTINTLRLWAAAAGDYFDFQKFGEGNFVRAIAEKLTAETITRVLYPDDRTTLGQALRFVQEYFLVACSLADLIHRFRLNHKNWNQLPEKIAIQMNDTHPAMAVAELMRILLDDAKLGWDEAWHLTQRALAYTNHTLLPEALETWPVAWFNMLQPRLLEIIFEINSRFLTSVRLKYPKDEGRVARLSLVDESGGRKIRMAHLAIVGSHSINGVAKIHSDLLRTKTVKELAELFPERFNNKTNGITQRRWLLLANPALAHLITDAIGNHWIKDLSQLSQLKKWTSDADFCSSFFKAKLKAKEDFSKWLKKMTGQVVNPHTIFDCQIKRIHEYKRQMLNALRILILYNRLKANPETKMEPRSFFFFWQGSSCLSFC